MIGPPFRLSFYTNYWFTGFSMFYFLFNVVMTYNPFDWDYVKNETFNATTSAEKNWIHFLFILVLINGALTLVWERVVVEYVAVRIQAIKKKKVSDQEIGRAHV